jgi:hypothetical protein
LALPVRSQEALDTEGEIEDTTVRYEQPSPEPAASPVVKAPAYSRRADSLRTSALEAKYKRGRLLAWTGLALTAAEPFLIAKYPEAALAHSYLLPIPPLLYLFGVPMAGTAAMDLGTLAKNYPGYRDPGNSGMTAYYSGVYLKFGAEAWLAYVILSNFEVGFLGPVPIPYIDAEGKDFVGPLAALGAGVVCDLYAMHRFSARYEEARRVLPGALALVPTLSLGKAGEVRPGALLAYRF